MTQPSQTEIDEQIEKAREHKKDPYLGMTYEQGVMDALEWVSGYVDDPPMEDEDE